MPPHLLGGAVERGGDLSGSSGRLTEDENGMSDPGQRSTASYHGVIIFVNEGKEARNPQSHCYVWLHIFPPNSICFRFICSPQLGSEGRLSAVREAGAPLALWIPAELFTCSQLLRALLSCSCISFDSPTPVEGMLGWVLFHASSWGLRPLPLSLCVPRAWAVLVSGSGINACW